MARRWPTCCRKKVESMSRVSLCHTIHVVRCFSSLSFMLKIWKRTWKGPDDPRPMRDNDEADILGGPSSSASSALPLENSGIKRSRTSGQLEDLINDQPHKKPRRHQQPASGSLGNHLPEINDADEVESLLPRSISAFREQVLEQAKHENSELGSFLLCLYTYITL